MTISFGLLGPVEATVDGCPLSLGGRQRKAVLAMLLLQAGVSVGEERLIWALWGEDPPQKAAKTLRPYLALLRKQLAPHGIGVVRVGAGYRLDADRADIDAFRFEELLTAGGVALAAGDPEQAKHLLGGALGLWRGAPLEDVADLPFAGTEVTRMGELWLRAVETRIDAELELGRHHVVIAELTDLLEQHPLRESLAATLATALYRADRQADALRVLRTTRQRLIDELGVDPGPRLRSIEVAVLRHEVDPPRPSAAIGRPMRLAPRPTGLAGREELLAALHARLVEVDESSPRVIALTGLGGVGKTSVAVEYAHRFGREYGLVWQFAAEDSTALSAQFAELAQLLGAPGWGDHSDPVLRTHTALTTRQDGWLLIFDNVTDPEAVRAMLPPVGSGHVLITSQHAHWPSGQAMELPVLERRAAVAYLQARTNDGDTAAAEALADELGFLPLALEQAGAFMEATGRRLSEYLELFRVQRAGLLTRGRPVGYDKRIATTWTLAFQHLHDSCPAAVTLLRLFSCYAPEAIPVRLLVTAGEDLPSSVDPEISEQLKALRADAFSVDDAVAALRRYSLIGPPTHGALSIHRLVQAVTADQLSAGWLDTWRHAAACLITAALPRDPEQPGNWPTYAALLPHARVVLDASSESLAQVVRYLGASGDYTTARLIGEQLLHARRNLLGPSHPDTLTTWNDLSWWTGMCGDAAAARDQRAALLPIRERVLGPEHPDTLTTQHGLAYWTGTAGDAAAARDQFAVLLRIRERVLGVEHPDTLAARHGQAYWTGKAGDVSAARDQLAALLPIRERVLGAEHPDTLITRHNLANWTGRAGDAAAARDQLAALLPIRERVLGAEHPDTLIVHHHLANWTGRAGDAAPARDQCAALLPVIERVLGEQHPDTLLTRHHLANWTGYAGDPVTARDQFAALMPCRERILGSEHPSFLTTRASLAWWTGEAGNAVAARDQYAALLPVLERIRGAKHPHTLTTRASLAHWTGRAGDPAAARNQYAALLMAIERVHGAEHPETLSTRRGLAYWTYEAGDPAPARDQYTELLPIQERAPDPQQPDTITNRTRNARR